MKTVFCQTVPLAWAEWWRAIGQSAGIEHRFPARNLLLDENIAQARAQSYTAYLSSVRSPVWPADALPYNYSAHRAYIVERLWKAHAGTLPTEIELSDWTCPETFQHIPSGSPFLDANLDLRLVRVERVDAVAARIGIGSDDLVQVANDALGGMAGAVRTLNVYFEALAAKSKVRPEFATFFGDVLSVFSESDWADRLRDTLGLIHFNPAAGSEIPVLVFSYPLRDLPCLQGEPAFRPLVPPVTLESNWNPAFCPSPPGSRTGHTIDLSARTSVSQRREVVHPTMQYRAGHVYRVGSIRRPVEQDGLEVARSLHLTDVRKVCARSEYASGTDSDIV